MLQSMTGYGEARLEAENISFLLEVRSLNNRFLKTVVKLPDALSFLEPGINSIIRAKLARGSVTCAVHMRYTGPEGAFEINEAAVQGCLAELEKLGEGQVGKVELTADMATLLQLPGMCEARRYGDEENERFKQIVKELTREALERLRAMRTEEGKGIRADLELQCEAIRENLRALSGMTDEVVQNYHTRLRERTDMLLAQAKLKLDEDLLAREVALFAERCDINEEISRLESHLSQFLEMSRSGEQVGRRLDFLTQELLREANTIGSKANDARISQHVVEIKVAIDRLKEQVQNVE